MSSKQCKLCNKNTHGHTKVYCDDVCKSIFKEVKLNVRKQTLAYRKEFNLGCTRCKKLLADHEGVYCDNCVATIAKTKQDRAEVIHKRPCLECGVDMISPSPNRKWCEGCKATLKKPIDVRVRKRAYVKKEVVGVDPKWTQPMGSKRRAG